MRGSEPLSGRKVVFTLPSPHYSLGERKIIDGRN
jgi:hypothetical protein